LRKTRVLCKFTVAKQDYITEGKFVQYPYPIKGIFDLGFLNVQCPTPASAPAGSGTVSVALNGQSFVGNLPVRVLTQLQINIIQPRCGPREGGTNVNLNLAGIQDNEYGNLYFSWSGVCTDPLTADLFAKPGQLTTITPPSPYQETSGGFSLVAFTARDKSYFQGNKTVDTSRNHFESSLDFLYYRRPVITRIQPHGGIYTGGTPVIIEGAFFFSEPDYGCTPKCKFGDQYVEAEFLSALRIRCIAPAGTLGTFVPLTVSMNGQDIADSAQNQTFAYINRPTITKISPTAGPSTGGTPLYIDGEGFVDLSQYPEEFACIFTPIDSNEPPKVTPASFESANQIICSTPGGWNAGTTTRVGFSQNGIDWSQDDVRFKFYQINRIFPLSGPANGESVVTISGSGLLPDKQVGPPACKINNVVVQALSATSESIQCRVPAASQGEQFHGNVDFWYTLDGERWEQVIQGFTYYQQPEITQVIPSYVASTGGTLKVKGSHFRANFYGAEPTCRLNNAYAPVEFVSDTEIRCPFDAVEFNPEQSLYLQVALNNASFTEKAEIGKVQVYQVTSIKPLTGPKQGGTPITVTGANFPANSVPRCKFGIPGSSTVSQGTVINENKITCNVPAAKFPKGFDTFVVPFELSFDNDEYDSWGHSGLYYSYYTNPQIADVSPLQVPVDQTELITITAKSNHPFNSSIVGSNVVHTNAFLDVDIVCRFGRFGTTSGALIDYDQIGCPSPNTRMEQTEIGAESVDFEISLNGQDFIKYSKPFTFIGTKTTAQSSSAWMVMLLFGTATFFFLLFVITKSFDPFNGQNRSQAKAQQPLDKEISKTDSLNNTQQPIIA